ncbi:MAG: MBL fold metallo-hydrolase [Syntrophaceae bacterium]|nr:MBL fold metallo-hydrolase [Syntrophaceae bacterium]
MVHCIPPCGFARCYVLSDREGLAVVDVGSVGAADDVVGFIGSQPGLSMAQVRFVLATHFHVDHIGGVARFLEFCAPGTKVFLHPLAMQYLQGKRELCFLKGWVPGFLSAALVSMGYVRRLSHLDFGPLAGIPLPILRDRRSFGVDADRLLALNGGGRTRYPLGFGGWEVLETPGHTEDSICLYQEAEGRLLTGDTILNLDGIRGPELNRFCWNKREIRRSFDMLKAELSPRTLYPGHGEVYSSNGENVLSFVRAA